MKISTEMIDHTLLVTWRNWYARNKITHNKPLPHAEGSKRFLCGYIKTLRDIKQMPTNQIFKDKQPLIDTGDRVKENSVKPTTVKPWRNSPVGFVKGWLLSYIG
jgi:hypothetical protein